MANTNSAIRFDHREIAVIFSLFIFVALLMFTVGILVGKGLAQAQYAGGLAHQDSKLDVAEVPAPNPASLGTSVSTEKHEEPAAPNKAEHSANEEHGEAANAKEYATNDHAPAQAEHAAANTEHGAGKQNEQHADFSSPSATMPAPKTVHASNEDEETPQAGNLKLIPKKPGVIADDPSKREAQHVMNDPKLSSLFEEAKGPMPKKLSKDRNVSSTDPLAGSDSGKYTLQVGSYPTKKDAEERVTALKKLGFSYAYTSAKTLEGSRDTWYRVWLGYYADEEAAKNSGDSLQKRGEIKNYIVKKTSQQD